MEQMDGSFYLLKRDDRGEPIGLLHVPAERVTIERAADGSPKRYVIDESGPRDTKPPACGHWVPGGEDVAVHVPEFGCPTCAAHMSR